MKRRLLIAKNGSSTAKLILDEPTAGVDVELRNNLWNNVKLLNKEGVTIILTTHYLLEAQEMCDHIAIINKGDLVALDTTQKTFRKGLKLKKLISRLKNNKEFNFTNARVKFNVLKDNFISVSYQKNALEFEQIINYLSENNIKILDIVTDDGNLEDVFVQLTNN